MHFHTHFRLVHIQYGIIGSESDQVLAKKQSYWIKIDLALNLIKTDQNCHCARASVVTWVDGY